MDLWLSGSGFEVGTILYCEDHMVPLAREFARVFQEKIEFFHARNSFSTYNMYGLVQ